MGHSIKPRGQEKTTALLGGLIKTSEHHFGDREGNRENVSLPWQTWAWSNHNHKLRVIAEYSATGENQKYGEWHCSDFRATLYWWHSVPLSCFTVAPYVNLGTQFEKSKCINTFSSFYSTAPLSICSPDQIIQNTDWITQKTVLSSALMIKKQY